MVRSIKLWKFVSGQDTVGTGLVGEEVVHGPGAPSPLPEGPLQDTGGADGLPPLQRKIIKMQAVKEVFLYAPDGPFFLHQPPGLLCLEAFDGLFAVLGGENELGFLEAMSLIGLSDFHRHVTHLMSHTALHLDERVDGLQDLQGAGVAIGNDELHQFLPKSPRPFRSARNPCQASVSSASVS